MTMTKLFNTHGKLRKALILLATFVALFLVAYLGRGWIRGTALPSYANHVYKPRASQAFNKSYPTIRAKLIASGMQLPAASASNSTALCDKLTNDESTLTFHGVHETISCNRMIGGHSVPATEAFIDRWQQKAPALADYLAASGYRFYTSGHDAPTLTNMFNTDTDSNDVVLVYTKTVDKAQCILQIYAQSYDYDAQPPIKAATAYADYQCVASLSVFGGYNYWARQ